MRVFLHTRSFGGCDWLNQFKDFDQIPALDEYIGLSMTDPNIYKVQMVVHTPFDEAECVAEVYAVAVNDLEAKNQSFPDMKD